MMLRMLALDCATTACSVALRVNGEIRVHHDETPRQHHKQLLPAIRALLAEAGLAPSSLDAVIVGVGPGSFVGVRMAVSAAQGLSFGADIPLLGVSSFQIWAQTAWQSEKAENIMIATDARMGQVNVGQYQLQGGVMAQCVEDKVVGAGDIVIPEDAVLLGDAWNGLLAKPSDACCLEKLLPQADAAFALISEADIQSAPSPASILPLYLQGTSPWRKQHEIEEKP